MAPVAGKALTGRCASSSPATLVHERANRITRMSNKKVRGGAHQTRKHRFLRNPLIPFLFLVSSSSSALANWL
jgi:hypothetical protein